jgi:hypothetical protein
LQILKPNPGFLADAFASGETWLANLGCAQATEINLAQVTGTYGTLHGISLEISPYLKQASFKAIQNLTIHPDLCSSAGEPLC